MLVLPHSFQLRMSLLLSLFVILGLMLIDNMIMSGMTLYTQIVPVMLKLLTRPLSAASLWLTGLGSCVNVEINCASEFSLFLELGWALKLWESVKSKLGWTLECSYPHQWLIAAICNVKMGLSLILISYVNVGGKNNAHCLDLTVRCIILCVPLSFGKVIIFDSHSLLNCRLPHEEMGRRKRSALNHWLANSPIFSSSPSLLPLCDPVCHLQCVSSKHFILYIVQCGNKCLLF